MKVRATQHIDVEVCDIEARRVAVAKIRTLFDFPEGHYVDWETGALMHVETVQYGAHDSSETTTIREATQEDQAAWVVIQKLKCIGG